MSYLPWKEQIWHFTSCILMSVYIKKKKEREDCMFTFTEPWLNQD